MERIFDFVFSNFWKFAILVAVLGISAYATIAYVLLHFVTKFW